MSANYWDNYLNSPINSFLIYKMGQIKNGIYIIGLLLRLNDIIHIKLCTGVTCMGLIYSFIHSFTHLFIWLREERFHLFLKWLPNTWGGHAPEDKGEEVIMCQGYLLSPHLACPRIQDKFLSITYYGVIGGLYEEKRKLSRWRLPREGLTSPYPAAHREVPPLPGPCTEHVMVSNIDLGSSFLQLAGTISFPASGNLGSWELQQLWLEEETLDTMGSWVWGNPSCWENC